MLSVRYLRAAGAAVARPTGVRSWSKSAKPVPGPRDDVPDAATFLSKIGRGMSDAVGKKITDWSGLFTQSVHDLKEAGLTPRQRKYLLRWREKYRQGEGLTALPVMKKAHGGERKRKMLGIK